MYGGVFEDVLRATYMLENVKYSSINIGDRFIHQYGSYSDICSSLGFSVEGILKKVKDELLYG
jgi:hypothetical protein